MRSNHLVLVMEFHVYSTTAGRRLTPVVMVAYLETRQELAQPIGLRHVTQRDVLAPTQPHVSATMIACQRAIMVYNI